MTPDQKAKIKLYDQETMAYFGFDDLRKMQLAALAANLGTQMKVAGLNPKEIISVMLVAAAGEEFINRLPKGFSEAGLRLVMRSFQLLEDSGNKGLALLQACAEITSTEGSKGTH